MCDICGNRPEWLIGKEEPKAKVAKGKRAAKAKGASVDREFTERPPARRAHVELPPMEREPVERQPPRPSAPAPQAELLAFFKQWRRKAAERAAVPAYVVLSDAALEDLCRKHPVNLAQLLAVSGIGERKAELYGSEIFAVFEAFRNGARAQVREVPQESPADQTLRLLAEGKSFVEIAEIRGRTLQSVTNMVGDLIEKGRLEYRVEWVGETAHTLIEEAIGRLGSELLKPLKEALPAEITYDQVRLVVANARKAAAVEQA